MPWLDHADSGMTGWEQNHWPGALCAADLDEVAGRLAAILDAEDADDGNPVGTPQAEIHLQVDVTP